MYKNIFSDNIYNMEHYANSIEDVLIDSLKYKLEPGASYVQSRRQVTWYPSGSAIYSPTSGTRFYFVLISILLVNGWIHQAFASHSDLIILIQPMKKFFELLEIRFVSFRGFVS